MNSLTGNPGIDPVVSNTGMPTLRQRTMLLGTVPVGHDLLHARL